LPDNDNIHNKAQCCEKFPNKSAGGKASSRRRPTGDMGRIPQHSLIFFIISAYLAELESRPNFRDRNETLTLRDREFEQKVETRPRLERAETEMRLLKPNVYKMLRMFLN